MGVMSKLLRSSDNNGISFWCPGCDEPHRIQYGEGAGPRWTFNGDVNKPTFTPSVLVRNGHYLGNTECWCTWNAKHPEDPSDFKCKCCHSFITDGNIQFLSDCSHTLAGQTVPLPTYKSPDNENM